MPSAAETVLFDLDGVLIDSRQAITTCMNDALEAVGQPRRDPAELDRFIGPPSKVAYAELAGDRADEALAAYRERYATASLELTTVAPGVLDAVERLRTGGHRLAVATSKPAHFARPIAERLGFAHHFEAIVGPDLDAHEETKAGTIARALERLGTTSAIMIGDREHDVHGARANGLDCVGVLWGIGDEAELRAAGASAIVATPDELRTALASVARL